MNESAYKGPRDSINAPSNQLSESDILIRHMNKIGEANKLLTAARQSLKRWATRYAGSDHAKKAVTATHHLIQQIDEWLLDQ
jgi:hypothetical protein